jgi:hypothetical protein
MAIDRPTYRTDTLIKWLFAVTLLLSIFTLSDMLAILPHYQKNLHKQNVFYTSAIKPKSELLYIKVYL